MNRENETSVHDAGARLIKAVRQMGFNNKCLVFTSDKRKAENILQSKLNSREQQCVTVSDVAQDLRNFVNFNKMPTHAQQSNVENPSKSNTSQNSTYSKNDTSSYKSTNNTTKAYQGATGGKHFTTYADTDNEMMHNSTNTNIDILISNCKMRNLANHRYK
ncbi:unnamed protein product [Rotaria sordida]|uniref:Uncharacterized protein n=1 Tax=Rotaria sordida TaxID=392033 RepID=A0A815C6S8_9BILA|nr:unnamed protein product [Rotaria sordida]CAF1558159.1 unnamed protein product [Rotaria sordida]